MYIHVFYVFYVLHVQFDRTKWESWRQAVETVTCRLKAIDSEDLGLPRCPQPQDPKGTRDPRKFRLLRHDANRGKSKHAKSS